MRAYVLCLLFLIPISAVEVENLNIFRAAVTSTHRPVILFLYAPWCGHCTSFKPEFKSFFNKAREIADVYAANAHKNEEFARYYNLKGFPTIITYHADKRRSWNIYNGPRTVGALLDHTKKQIVPSARFLTNEKDLNKHFLDNDRINHAVFLFTDKQNLPTLFNLVASHPDFFGKIPFFAVQKASRDNIPTLEKHFPDDTPHIVILSKNQTHIERENEFTEKVNYKNLQKYVSNFLLPIKREDNSCQIKLLSTSSIENHCTKNYCVVLLEVPENIKVTEEIAHRFETDKVNFLRIDKEERVPSIFTDLIHDKRTPSMLIFKQRNGITKYHLDSFASLQRSQTIGQAIGTIEKLLDGSLNLKHLQKLQTDL